MTNPINPVVDRSILIMRAVSLICDPRVQSTDPVEDSLALEALIQEAKDKLRECRSKIAATLAHSERQPSAAVVARQEERQATAKAIRSIYDATRLLGRPLGDIKFSELPAFRKEGRFAAALADRILKFGKPASEQDMVRDVIKEKTLAEFVDEARRESESDVPQITVTRGGGGRSTMAKEQRAARQ